MVEWPSGVPKTWRCPHHQGQVSAFARWWPICKRYARTPLPSRPDGSRREPAAAVWADVVQLVLDAIRTERALVGANARLSGGWRQVHVAVFAVRPQFQGHSQRLVSDMSHCGIGQRIRRNTICGPLIETSVVPGRRDRPGAILRSGRRAPASLLQRRDRDDRNRRVERDRTQC